MPPHLISLKDRLANQEDRMTSYITKIGDLESSAVTERDSLSQQAEGLYYRHIHQSSFLSHFSILTGFSPSCSWSFSIIFNRLSGPSFCLSFFFLSFFLNFFLSFFLLSYFLSFFLSILFPLPSSVCLPPFSLSLFSSHSLFHRLPQSPSLCLSI